METAEQKDKFEWKSRAGSQSGKSERKIGKADRKARKQGGNGKPDLEWKVGVETGKSNPEIGIGIGRCRAETGMSEQKAKTAMSERKAETRMSKRKARSGNC